MERMHNLLKTTIRTAGLSVTLKIWGLPATREKCYTSSCNIW